MGRPIKVLAAGLAGFLAYCACLLALAPATLLDSAMARSSAGRVRLADAHGTLWSGTGQLEVRDASGAKGLGSPLSWRFDPQQLLRGQAGFQVRFADAVKGFPLRFSLTGFEVADAEFSLLASVLGLALPNVALIGPSGELAIRVARLSVAGTSTTGEAVVNWRAAGSALTPVSPLGDYELRIQGDPAGSKASLRTLKGPLQLSGTGASPRNRPLAFTVNARVDPNAQTQLTPFLRLIAVEREAGNFELQIGQAIGGTPGNPAAQIRP